MKSLKKVEIFCGTGGVGKTTIATSRAINLALQGYKVLILTIDPSRRLKQVFGIENIKANEIPTFQLNSQNSLDILLVDPASTLKRLSLESGKELDQLPILKTLSKPFGGMNEIFALEELAYQFDKKNYNYFILDTAPGGHIIDFLNNADYIQQFFDKKFMSFFNSIASNKQKDQGILQKTMFKAFQKAAFYLEKITGKEFLNSFIQTVNSFYASKDSFFRAIEFKSKILSSKQTQWFLVTSTDQDKFNQILALKGRLYQQAKVEQSLIVNRSQIQHLEGFQPPLGSLSELYADNIIGNEDNLKKIGQNHFKSTCFFPEVQQTSPLAQTMELEKYWNNYDYN